MLYTLVTALLLQGAPGDTTKAYRAYETKGVAAYRKHVSFTDPYNRLVAAPTVVAQPLPTAAQAVAVTVDMDPAISRLLQLHLTENEARTEADGYRVQLYAGSREVAARVREDVAEMFKDEYVYAFYDRPYFKVRMGNFLDLDDANKICQLLRTKYPGAFVVPDLVKLNK